MAERKKRIYSPPNVYLFKQQALAWAGQFNHVHLFADNAYKYPFGGFANFLAAGCAEACPIQPGKSFTSVQQFHNFHCDWLIGHFTYDLKNEIEDLKSKNKDYLQFPAAYFYIPQHLIHFREAHVIIETLSDPEEIYQQIIAYQLTIDSQPISSYSIHIHARTTPDIYQAHVEKIKDHIVEGDVYELNYCMEFYTHNVQINPWRVYTEPNAKSPMPFSVYGRIHEHYLMCASPERFLKKTGNQLLSQPIKGTAQRGGSQQEDEKIKIQLRNNEKEPAENMMIVDLVRNDLAKSASTGSIKVEEMFGIYTFPQLHQMISSVSALIRPGVSFTEAIRNAFPMGSMTGAPKIKAMELIDEYEQAYRGLYSGTVGYITPEADFDFNVVIRSILYNAESKYLSFQAGSAITYDASTQQEYQECLLKANAIQNVLHGSIIH